MSRTSHNEMIPLMLRDTIVVELGRKATSFIHAMNLLCRTDRERELRSCQLPLGYSLPYGEQQQQQQIEQQAADASCAHVFCSSQKIIHAGTHTWNFAMQEPVPWSQRWIWPIVLPVASSPSCQSSPSHH